VISVRLICESCQIYDICETCNSTYFWNGSECTQDCPISTWPNSVNRIRDPCPSSCQECTSSANCTTCKSGYYLNNQDMCVSIVTECQAYQYFDQSTLQCRSCLEDCRLCFDNLTCSECESRYFYDVNDRKCKECYPSCEKCFGSELEDCPNLKLSEASTTTNAVVGAVLVAVSGASAASLVMSGDSSSINSQLTVIQHLLLLLFLNLKFSPNLASFLARFKIGTMSFIPNPFSLIDWEDDCGMGAQSNSYSRFRHHGFTTISFMDMGHLMLLFVTLAIIHILSAQFVSNNTSEVGKIAKIIRDKAGVPLLFKMFVSTTPVLLISLMLNLMTPNFECGLSIISWIFALIIALGYCFVTFKVYHIHQQIQDCQNKINQT